MLQLHTIADAQIIRQTLHLDVTNIADARQEILENVRDFEWELTSFIINRTSLEDLFMKAVQQ